LELASTDDQLSFQVFYGIGRAGIILPEKPTSLPETGTVEPLLKAVIEHIPAPKNNPETPFRLLVSALDYDTHLGQIVIGRVSDGKIVSGQSLIKVGESGRTFTVTKVLVSQGINRVEISEASAGDIVMLAGVTQATIGSTLGAPGVSEPLPSPEVGDPTLNITLGPNSSPFSGKEGKYTTGRQLGERLERELKNNVGLRVTNLDNSQFIISGRGELHLSVLLETMRREGYEMEIGKPEAIVKDMDGEKCEPIEEVDILVHQDFVGVINQELGKRQAKLIHMEPVNESEVEFIYHLPTRSLIGLRSLLLTLTKGTLIMNSQIIGYQPVGLALPKLRKGALITAESGMAVEYGLRALKNHGVSFVIPGTKVYEGMIVGLNNRDDDIEINVCKEKNLTNHRTKSHQGITQLAPDIDLSLEQAIDLVESDELLEITPQSLRLRKKYLNPLERHRAEHAKA
jgi:GTP-binding protein